jgi:hypothetical protein
MSFGSQRLREATMSQLTSIGWGVVAFVLATAGALILWLSFLVYRGARRLMLRAPKPETRFEANTRGEAHAGALLVTAGIASIGARLVYQAIIIAPWEVTVAGFIMALLLVVAVRVLVYLLK